MTPNSFGGERMLFGVKFRYGRWANTSSLGNGFTRVARIKQGEDGVLLSKREGSDHDGVCYYIMIIILKIYLKHHKIHNTTAETVDLTRINYNTI